MFECSKCEKISDKNDGWHGLAHTDILWCNECFKNIQPERLSERDDKIAQTNQGLRLSD
jgi:hypothetical protein